MDVFGEETSNEAYLVRPGTRTQLPGKFVNHSTSYMCSLAQEPPTGMKNYEPRPPIIRTLGLSPSTVAVLTSSAIGNIVLTGRGDALRWGSWSATLRCKLWERGGR